MALISKTSRPARRGHRPRIRNGLLDPKWLMSLGCRFYAPLVPPYGSKAIIENGNFIPHRAVAATTETIDSDGTYIREENSDYITGAVTDTARIEGAGARIEGASTNLIDDSADFDDATTNWTNTTTVGNTNITAPDGTASGWELEDDNASAIELAFQTVSSLTANTNPYFLSCFFKKTSGSLTYLPALVSNFSSVGNTFGGVSLNTTTGVATEITSGGVTWDTLDSFGVDDYGDWWRLWLVHSNSSKTSNVVRINPAYCTAAAPAVGSVTAAVGTVTVWGAHFEQIAFPTSYIPTAGSSVARSADLLAYAVAGNTASHEGTILVTVRPEFSSTDSLPGVGATVFDTEGVSAQNGLFLDFLDSANGWRLFAKAGGTTSSNLSVASAHSRGDIIALGVTWEPNDYRISKNGQEIAQGTLNAAVMDTHTGPIQIGSLAAGTRQFQGNISHFAVFPEKLPQSVLDLYSQTTRSWVANRVFA